MLAQAVIDLSDGRLRGGHMAERVQQHEVVDRAVVANRLDSYACLFQLAGICLALVAQRIVLRGDDECGGQALELVDAGTEGWHIGIVAGLGVGSIEVPAILHEGARQEAAGAILAIGNACRTV
jgi:hypothetical protein